MSVRNSVINHFQCNANIDSSWRKSYSGWKRKIIAVLLVLAVGTPGHSLSGDFSVEVSALDRDLISIQASDASVKEILLELSEKTGFTVSFVSDVTDRVTVDLIDLSVERILAQLAPNHLLVSEAAGGKQVIKEVTIITDDTNARSSQAGYENLPSGEPAPQILDNSTPGSADSELPPADQSDSELPSADPVSPSPVLTQ